MHWAGVAHLRVAGGKLVRGWVVLRFSGGWHTVVSCFASVAYGAAVRIAECSAGHHAGRSSLRFRGCKYFSGLLETLRAAGAEIVGLSAVLDFRRGFIGSTLMPANWIAFHLLFCPYFINWLRHCFTLSSAQMRVN